MRTLIPLALLAGCDATPSEDTDTDTDVADDRPACDAPIDVSLSGVATPTEGVPWTQGGVTLEVRKHAGDLAIDTETFGCLWLHPGELHASTATLPCRPDTVATTASSSFCAAGCATLTARDADGTTLGSVTNDGTEGDLELGVAAPIDTVVLGTEDTIVCGLRFE